MGSLSVKLMFDPSPESVDDAHEISAKRAWSDVNVMRIGHDKANGREIVYLDETEMQFATVVRGVEGPGDRKHYWFRMELKINSKNELVRHGHNLVMVSHPYAITREQHTVFKRAVKKSPDDPRRFDPPPWESALELVTWVESLDYDYWEKGNYLTAAISLPVIPYTQDGGSKNFKDDLGYVFGTCESFDTCYKALEISKKAQLLLDATEKNKIKVWHNNVSIPLQLFPEVIEDRFFWMGLSISQALAGPHKDSDKWFGRPVIDKVDQIYRGHLNNVNRGLRESYGKRDEFSEDMRYGIDDEEQCDP